MSSSEERRRGPSDTYGQACPIAVALDTIGDRWTLLLLRDLAHAPLRFSDLQTINPRLSPNLLTKRLRHLETVGLVERRELPPPASSVVYAITESSRAAIVPILNALGLFGAFLFQRAEPGPLDPLLDQLHRNGTWVLAKGIDFSGHFLFDFGGAPVGIHVGPNTFEPSTRAPENPTATIILEGTTMPILANGGITLAEAETTGRLKIEGDRDRAIALLTLLCLTDPTQDNDRQPAQQQLPARPG